MSLTPIGMTGCRSLADFVATFPTAADGSGIASVTLALADAPVFTGNLYAQWIWVDAAANALGLRSSLGIQIAIR